MSAPTEMLSIGQLAVRTGVSAATLRMWESRHGFPQAHRLTSGHRRYPEQVVDSVQTVQRRRASGARLEAAIAEVTRAPRSAPSVHAELRRRHPELTAHTLRKSTLTALCLAIEDEIVARADDAILFGSFQHDRHLSASLPRWKELARTARGTFTFASGEVGDHPGIAHVALAPDAPMLREWCFVCDGTAQPVALSAWELTGQQDVEDRDRLFETVWTFDARAVRAAAQVCADLAFSAGDDRAVRVLEDAPAPSVAGPAEMVAAANLFTRAVAYLERRAATPPIR